MSGIASAAAAGAGLRSFFSSVGPLGGAAIALAVALLFAYAVLRVASRRRSSLAELIAPYHLEQLKTAAGPVERPAVVTVPVLRRLSGPLGRATSSTRLGRRLGRLLLRSDVPVELGELVVVWALTAVVVVAFAALLGHLLGALLALVLVASAPPVALSVVVARRTRKFAEQLPDILKLTASSLRAGFSFSQSLDGVVRQLKDPARRELERVLAEVRLGRVLEDALDEAAQRIGNRDFSEAVMAVRIQQETGGNLAALLDVLANTMTLRLRMRREIRTLTAEGRVSAIVLGLLPIALALFIFSVNRSYIAELYHTFPGQVALAAGAVLEVVGFVWMYRIVKIEV